MLSLPYKLDFGIMYDQNEMSIYSKLLRLHHHIITNIIIKNCSDINVYVCNHGT